MSKNNTSLPPPKVRVKPAPPPPTPRKLSVFEQQERRERIAYNRKKWEEAMAEAQEHCMKYHGGLENNCICAEEDCHCDGCECNCWEGSEPDESFDFEPDSDDEDWY